MKMPLFLDYLRLRFDRDFLKTKRSQSHKPEIKHEVWKELNSEASSTDTQTSYQATPAPESLSRALIFLEKVNQNVIYSWQALF